MIFALDANFLFIILFFLLGDLYSIIIFFRHLYEADIAFWFISSGYLSC